MYFITRWDSRTPVPESCAAGSGLVARSKSVASRGMVPPRPVMPLRVFLSHSSKTEFANKVRDRVFDGLTALGHEVLLDRERLEPGTPIGPQKWGTNLD